MNISTPYPLRDSEIISLRERTKSWKGCRWLIRAFDFREADNVTREEIVLEEEDTNAKNEPAEAPVVPRKPRKRRRAKRPSADYAPEEVEMPLFPLDVPDEGDSDKLFLLSFLPEIKQFPLDIRMWVRAQIANVMQEAVTTHMSKMQSSSENGRYQVKKPRDSFD